MRITYAATLTSDAQMGNRSSISLMAYLPFVEIFMIIYLFFLKKMYSI